MSYFGLTGSVATGKTTAARMFQDLGAVIVDADRVGHELLAKDSPAYPEIIRQFGKDILEASGEISRPRLGALVFADSKQREKLNAIVHPQIIQRVEQKTAEQSARDPQAIVLVDAALIFEAGIGANFRKVVVTWCRPEQQVERLIAKGLTGEQAQQRIASQMASEEKRRRADFVIDSSGSLESTRAQAGEIYTKLKALKEVR